MGFELNGCLRGLLVPLEQACDENDFTVWVDWPYRKVILASILDI